MYSLFEIGLFIFLIFVFVYIIIDRICKCIEHKHIAESFNASLKIKKEENTNDDEINK